MSVTMKQALLKKLQSLHHVTYINTGYYAVVWQLPQGILPYFIETDDEILLHDGHIYMFYITKYNFSAIYYQQQMEYLEGLPACVIKI